MRVSQVLIEPVLRDAHLAQVEKSLRWVDASWGTAL